MIGISFAALVGLSEWLFWEVVAFRVGALGTMPLAIYTTFYSLEPVLFMLPLGMSTAIAHSVGNLLGAGKVAQARRVTAIGLTVGMVIVCAYAAIVYA